MVWEGNKTGVFNSWAECQKSVKGYAGAKFKSFDSLAAAKAAFANPDSVKSKKKKKKTMYYVVWNGEKPGIYTDWDVVKKMIAGASNPQYKAFGSKSLAEKAFGENPEDYAGKSFKKTRDQSPEDLKKYGLPIPASLSVDAACNDKGDMEYRGVITDSGTEVFRVGPYKNGSNNIGEFLALVHGLAYLKKNRTNIPIYSDSKIAMGWVKAKKNRSKVAMSVKLVELCKRAEKWLAENDYENPIVKWQTKFWGEIPADFGRK